MTDPAKTSADLEALSESVNVLIERALDDLILARNYLSSSPHPFAVFATSQRMAQAVKAETVLDTLRPFQHSPHPDAALRRLVLEIGSLMTAAASSTNEWDNAVTRVRADAARFLLQVLRKHLPADLVVDALT